MILLERSKELRKVFGLSLGDYEEGGTTQLTSTKYQNTTSTFSFSLKIPFLFSFPILFCQVSERVITKQNTYQSL